MLCAKLGWHNDQPALGVPSASLYVQSLTFREVHCCGDTSSRWDCQVTAGCAPPEALSCRRAVRPLMKDTPGTLDGSGWGCLGTALYTFPGLQQRKKQVSQSPDPPPLFRLRHLLWQALPSPARKVVSLCKAQYQEVAILPIHSCPGNACMGAEFRMARVACGELTWAQSGAPQLAWQPLCSLASRWAARRLTGPDQAPRSST